MELFLDPTPGRGATAALYEQLRAAIVEGRLSNGDRLPPSRELAAELGISRHTVTTVYGRLVAEGYLEGRAGGGTHVSFAAESERRRRRSAALRPLSVPADRSFTEPPPPDGADLRIGLPDPALFPLVDWRRCVVTALQVAPTRGVPPAGVPELRRTLARWIARSRGVEADPANVVVTASAQQAVGLVARVLVRPGDRVVMEDPGYAPVRWSLESLGIEVVPVPVDAEGIVVDAIPPGVRLVYVTPSHQSPTGATMSLPRRRALLDLAARRDVAVVEDDYDSEFRHTDRPLEPLFRLDRSGRVVYVGTFSKILSPSVRLGVVAVPDSLTEAVVALAAHTGGQPPAVTQQAMHELIGSGHLDRHLRRARRAYAARHARAAELVGELVADSLLLPGPPSYAGLHLSARLPDGVMESDVLTRARQAGVALTALATSWSGPPGWQGLLIGYGRADGAALDDGIGRLRDVLASSVVRR